MGIFSLTRRIKKRQMAMQALHQSLLEIEPSLGADSGFKKLCGQAVNSVWEKGDENVSFTVVMIKALCWMRALNMSATFHMACLRVVYDLRDGLSNDDINMRLTGIDIKLINKYIDKYMDVMASSS